MIVVKDLSVVYYNSNDKKNALENISISFGEEKTIGIVGESGSGKSTLMFSLLGILPENAELTGNCIVDEYELYINNSKNNTVLLNNKFAYVPQFAFTALSPAHKIYHIIYDICGLSHAKQQDIENIKTIFESLNLSINILNKYPYQLSGGMLQRLLIAIAVMSNKTSIFFDEPTYGLDKENIDKLTDLIINNEKLKNMQKIIVSHDLNFVFNICNEIIIMKDGKVVEKGTKQEIQNSTNEYTKKLLFETRHYE